MAQPSKIPCTRCGAMILPATAEQTGGLCMPCRHPPAGHRAKLNLLAAAAKVRMDRVPKNWLTKRMTVEDAEATYTVKDDRLGPFPIPFGFLNDLWKGLLAQMVEGDQLWQFCTSGESWKNDMGRAGIALVRDGEVVASIITSMN